MTKKRHKQNEEAGEQKSATWAKHLEDWKRSEQSQREYCAERGLALSSFQWWGRKLCWPLAKKAVSTFLALPITASGAVVEIELRSKTRLRLEGEAALRMVAGLVGRIR